MLDPLKTALSEFLHLSKDALHIHLGIGIYLLSCLILRRRIGSWLPLLALLVLELINEGFDIAHSLDRGYFGPGSLMGTAKDIVNTMLWPLVLVTAVRLGLIFQPPAPKTLPPEPGRR